MRNQCDEEDLQCDFPPQCSTTWGIQESVLSCVTTLALLFMIFVFMMVWTEDPPPLVSETDLSSAYSSKRYRGDERNWTDYTLEKNNLKVRIVQNSPEMQGRSAISISYRYAEFKDPAGREGVSNIVNNALFTTGNRASSLWSTLVTEYNIYYKRVDKYEDSYYGAEFDSRGFEEVLTHLAAGLIDPQCTEANGFDISAVGDDEFNKYDASPLERGVLAEISYSDPKSKWGRINNLNTTKLFPGVSKAEWEKTVAGWVCQSIKDYMAADMMYLSVITDKTLDEAKTMLSTKFGTIQATGNVSLTNDPNPHTGIYAKQIIRYTTGAQIKSIESQRDRILNIQYWFPEENDVESKFKTEQMMKLLEIELCTTNVGGFLNSVRDYLKTYSFKECGGLYHFTQYTPFTVALTLNLDGFNNIEKILDNFFLYLKVIKDQDYDSSYFEQDQLTSQLKFYWGTSNNKLQEAIDLSEGLRLDIPGDNIFNWQSVLSEFNSGQLDSLLDFMLQTENQVIVIGASYADWSPYQRNATATRRRVLADDVDVKARSIWSDPLTNYQEQYDMYSDKYTIPTEWTIRWKDLNTKTQVCENLQTKANSVDDSWIPSNFDIKTDCLDFFTTIQESYSDQYSRCLEEEKKCDKWCAPWVPSPGVYWKANRNFEVPVVSIDIIFTNVGYSEGAIADVAEAAAQLYLNDNVQTATIGYNVKAGVYGDQTVDIRLDGYGDKIDELYKSVDGYFASVSNYLSQGRDSIKSYYEELNKKLDAQAVSTLRRIISQTAILSMKESLERVASVTQQDLNSLFSGSKRVLFFGNLNKQQKSDFFASDAEMTAYSEASITSFDLSSNIQPGTAYTFTKGNDNPLQYDRGIASYYGCGQWNEKNYALCKVMLEVWKANTDLAQYGYLNMNLEETFKDTIGIEVSIAIHKLNNTSVSIKDVDKAIETELKEALNTITQLTEQDIINTYNSLKDSAILYMNSFDEFREAYYTQAKFQTIPRWSWQQDLENMYGKLDKQDLLDFYNTYFYRESTAVTNKCQKATVWIYTQEEAKETARLAPEDTACFLTNKDVLNLDSIRNNFI